MTAQEQEDRHKTKFYDSGIQLDERYESSNWFIIGKKYECYKDCLDANSKHFYVAKWNERSQEILSSFSDNNWKVHGDW